MASVKAETHTPLVVDANAPLPGTVATQGFEPVRWRHAQVVHYGGSVQLRESHQRTPKNVRRQAAGLARQEQAFGLRVCEVFNHRPIINKLFIGCSIP
jgi:hypothetical protein